MPSFNKVMMIGNLTRDPQVKQLPSQTTLAEFGLAMSRKYRTAAGEDREEVCFVDCTAFGKQAEVIHQFCKKGKQIFIEGRLRYDTWEDKAGGAKRSKLTVVVENFQFLGSRADAFGDTPPGETANMFDDAGRRPHRGERNDRSERGDRPSRPQADPSGRAEGRSDRGGRNPERAEQPFGEEKMFEEADIPF
jgi:single-strand DNA-binding protein